MAENSNIEWTHHTFNPWRGCTKVSAGCANCYAETLSKRNPATLGEWGPKGKRVMAAESYWKQPLKWNTEAEKAGERRRVFCASLADVFEDRPELVEPRMRLFDLVIQTPHLDWLLLTKRPENIGKLVPPDWKKRFPVNAWAGTSVEDEKTAHQRIKYLLCVPSVVRFLSMEPLLSHVDLDPPLCQYCWDGDIDTSGDPPWCTDCDSEAVYGHWLDSCADAIQAGINWVIVGGESGPNARPMHPDWVRSIRDQCQEKHVSFLFKQWGEWLPFVGDCGGPYQLSAIDPKSNYGNLLPLDKQEAMWPDGTKRIVALSYIDNDTPVLRVGKKAAGRLLDGRTWDEYPEVNP